MKLSATRRVAHRQCINDKSAGHTHAVKAAVFTHKLSPMLVSCPDSLPSVEHCTDVTMPCCSADHLHLFVTAPTPKSFEEAKGLAVNLIDTVRADHAKQTTAAPSQPAPTAQASMPAMLQHSQPLLQGQAYPQMLPQQQGQGQQPQGQQPQGQQQQSQHQQMYGQQSHLQSVPMHSHAPPVLQQPAAQLSDNLQRPENGMSAPAGQFAPQWQQAPAGKSLLITEHMSTRKVSCRSRYLCSDSA